MSGHLTTKIMTPTLQVVLERQRCFEIIDAALTKPVVWLSAPAGAGKTTLVANYLDNRKVCTLWYRIDERDIDVAFFFRYMQKALKAHNPAKDTTLPEFVSENSRNINSFAMLWFERLFEELQSPCVLVFDDYQDIANDSLLHQVLSKGLSLLPDGVNAIFISRTGPPLSYTWFHAKRKIDSICFNEIKFTLKETAELIKNDTEYVVQDDVINRLHDNTGGWVTGLILTIDQINRTKNTAIFNVPVANEIMFDYLSKEIFDSAETDVKEFLLNTAYLPEFTVEMAGEIAPKTQAGEILTSKNKQYFFTERYTDGGVIFGYHDLFRDFLLNQSKDYYGLHLDEIVLRAANILEEHGYVEESARLLIEIKRWERFEELILKHVQHMITEGKHTLVDSWFASMPDKFMQDHPWLLYWHGMNKMALNPEDARMKLELAYAIFKGLRHWDCQLSALCAIIKTFMFELKDFHPLDHWIAEFEGSLVETYKHTKSDRIREDVVSSIVSALIFRQPGHKDMDYWLMEAEVLVRTSKHIENRIFVAYNLIMYYLWSGVAFKAGVIADILSLPVREMKTHPMLRLMYLRADAMYLYYRLSTKEVIKTVEEGLKIAQETGIHLIDSILSGVAVYVSLAGGNNEIAEEHLKKIQYCMKNTQSYPSFYYLMASMVALSKGVHPAAIEYAQRNVALIQQSGCQFMLGINKVILANILVEAGWYDEAMQHLKDIDELVFITKSETFIYFSYATKSLIALKNNDKKQFKDMFEKCVQLGKVSGIRVLFPLQQSAASVCKVALERGIEVTYAKELVSLHNITTDDHLIEDWPWAIKIYTLGRFEIFKDGKPLKFSGKTQKIPLLMLKALVSLGGRDVDTVRLYDHLWPDADGDAASMVFRTTLHRLRKLLGENDVIEYTDRRLGLNPRLCWVDIWAIDDIVSKISITRQNGSNPEKKDIIDLFLKLASLYKGEFIPGEQGETWSIQMREGLKGKFIRACLQVGDCLEESDKWEDAIGCYRKALSIYVSHEVFYQRLMRCNQKIGQTAEVISAYNTCREVLSSTFGVEPSPATRAIYASALKREDKKGAAPPPFRTPCKGSQTP
ncbi:MAG: hypothetical protein HQL03_13090 [Nitrospirae bacterium]|nr:hypothetical protein [Nitrospirota bacterium]